MELLIAGSLAYDTLESEVGRADEVLGGSATYAGLSARFHMREGRVGLIGAVGEDFLADDWELLSGKGLDLSGVSRLSAPTFRWHGRYATGNSDAQTVSTQMNAMGIFDPEVPLNQRNPVIFLCGNLHPRIQEKLLLQVESKLLIVDTMNKWITGHREQLNRVLGQAQLVVINETELRMLSDEDTINQGAASLLAGQCLSGEGSPEIVVVKRGRHGAVAYGPWGEVSSQGVWVDRVVDPTGCGDVFAGAMAAHLLGTGLEGLPDAQEMAAALVHANRTASFNLEAFGVTALAGLETSTYAQRL